VTAPGAEAERSRVSDPAAAAAIARRPAGEKPARRIEPKLRDWDVPPAPAEPAGERAASRDRRPLPAAVFSSGAAADEGAPARASFPWGAVLAVAVASLAVGGAGGYALGLRRAASSGAAAAASSSPTDTDVTVPAPSPAAGSAAAAASTPPPTVSEPVSSAAAAPTSSVTGRVSVHSVPAGATVTINGRQGGPTPQTFRDLPLGTFTITVSRSGYVSKTEQVALTADAPSKDVTVTLVAGSVKGAAAGGREAQAPARTGVVSVDTRPRGARVTLDGKAVGLTPLRVPAVAVGTHILRVELSGYRPVSTNVIVKAGATARVTLSLEHTGGHPAARPARRP